MKIYGMEKLSLVDYDGYAACVLFTGGCVFRCPFCQNAPLVTDLPQAVSEGEIFAHLKKRRNVLDAVVISGGEPTINKDLPAFIKRIKSEFGYLIKLDTSGSNPEMLEQLIDEKLIDYVAMDIKNDLPDYDITVGIEGYDTSPIVRSIEILKQGKIDYEFRTTLVEELHSEKNIRGIAGLISGAPRMYLQKFVDSGACIAEGLTPVPKEIAEKYLEILRPYARETELRSY